MKPSEKLNISLGRKRNINPIFNDVQLISPKQVILAYYMIEYRKTHNLSQQEMAEICSLFGKASGVRFSQNDIARYELYKSIPTQHKFQVLMNTLNIKSL